jgi:hypothetical protein
LFQKSPSFATLADGHEGAMFIDDVQTVKTPDGVAPSFVGFERVDQLESIWPNARYYSSADTFVRFGGVMDGELISTLDRITINGDKQRIDVVQCAPETVKNIPGDDGHDGRHGCVFNPSNVAFFGLEVALVDNFVRVRIKEPFHLCVKLANVLVGPFDLAVNCICGR